MMTLTTRRQSLNLTLTVHVVHERFRAVFLKAQPLAMCLTRSHVLAVLACLPPFAPASHRWLWE